MFTRFTYFSLDRNSILNSFVIRFCGLQKNLSVKVILIHKEQGVIIGLFFISKLSALLTRMFVKCDVLQTVSRITKYLALTRP